ncbi:hypothetical protein AMS68_003808 [Peltaster fructicola]|uniref:Transcription factor domain-containing protein n=1 Tax=Peltaster fructicola TaxID=286661 RepID=A0A6H0XUE9_9PEZI|nr:hypothetical protein AMS68_003808 [Peltaster fructicola]
MRCSRCVNSDDYVTGSTADSLALDTPLPISEPAFAAGQEESRLTLVQALARSRPEDNFSLWAQFLTFLFFWAKVRDHIASRRTSTQNEVLTSLLNLQQELAEWLTTIHPSLAYSKRNLFEQVVYKQDSIFSALHTMLHHCRLTLHSSLVPRFSGKLSCNLPAEIIKMSTEASIRSAAGLAEIANDLIAFDCDYAKLPPYVGYCMYVAGSIHVTMISSPALGETARKNLGLNMTVLQGMKPFWAILERLWQRLVSLCETHVAKGSFSVESILPGNSTGNEVDADTLDRPIPAYSLTVVKEEPRLDQLVSMSQMTPPDESTLLQSSITDDQKLALSLGYSQPPGCIGQVHETSFDFGDLANTYGEDWWHLDSALLPSGDSIDLQWA